MDYQERLKNLPPEVMTAFSESFIFLISNDKVQHFPARDLTQAEMIQRVKEKLGEAVTWSLWQGFVIAVNSEKNMCCCFAQISSTRWFLKMNKGAKKYSLRFIK